MLVDKRVQIGRGNEKPHLSCDFEIAELFVVLALCFYISPPTPPSFFEYNRWKKSQTSCIKKNLPFIPSFENGFSSYLNGVHGHLHLALHSFF